MASIARIPADAQVIPTFHAQWDDSNASLRDPVLTTSQKVSQFVWNLISCIILPILIIRGIVASVDALVKFFSKKFVIPATWMYSDETIHQTAEHFNRTWVDPVSDANRSLRDHYEAQNYHLYTPDNVQLNAFHFKHHQSTPETPTLLFFQSNGSYSYAQIYLWLMRKAIANNSVCNFVVFDYRGVVASKGDPETGRDLKVDGETAFQFVRDHLHVPPDQIRWYGWSLGGALASNIKALHPECTGRFVNERSFSSIRKILEAILTCVKRIFLFWIPNAVQRVGWNIVAPLEKIRGETLVVYTPEDGVIPDPASAYREVRKANLDISTIELYQTPEQNAQSREWALRNGRHTLNHHIEPLRHYSVLGQPGITADDAIANFILPPALAAANEEAV